MDKPTQVVVIGSGSSLKDGIDLGLWEKLKDCFTISTNYNYRYFIPTIQTWVDHTFYKREFKNLTNLPLIVGNNRKIDQKHPNTILVPTYKEFDLSLKQGIYSPRFTGLFSMTLGVALLGQGSIFMLGMDAGEAPKTNVQPKSHNTHFYGSEVKHRGVGYIGPYDKQAKIDRDWNVYADIPNIKIYNVSPISRIKCFEKISYEQFFKLLDTKKYSQDELREYVKTFLTSKFPQ